jgi:hypothetical protein
MATPLADLLTYYTRPGPLTTLPDNEAIRALLAGLPPTIPDLVQAVQNTLIHIFWADQYGVTLSAERQAEVNIRTAAARLQRIYDVDPAPLTVARPPDQKSVGNCRDHSVLMVALLRHLGIPARARCGFGTYFRPEQYVDHWVAEYWNAGQGRWIMVDAQLDALQRDMLGVDFDTLDVPHDRFITAGHAWQMCRQAGADPDRFGMADLHGLWFVQGDLLRDIAALNKMELLPWDGWGLAFSGKGGPSESELAFLDRMAALTLGGNDAFDDLRSRYSADLWLTVPPVILSFPNGPKPVQITLADEPGWVAPTPATKAELLASITRQHQRLEAAFAGLNDAALTQPDVVGFWSIKDVMAHVARCERLVTAWYRTRVSGDSSVQLELGYSSEAEDRMNLAWYEQDRHLSLDETRAVFKASYDDLRSMVEAMSEDEIFRRGHYPWTGPWPLLLYLCANTDNHYAEHAGQIEVWRRLKGKVH